MNVLFILSLGLAVVAAVPARNTRIVGGSVTNIQRWPYSAVVLSGSGNNFRHSCGSSIINNRSILSAAHCFENNPVGRFRIRVGSTYSQTGGIVYTTQRFVNHPNYRRATLDSDVTVLRVNGHFNFNNNIRAGRIAGPTYNLSDNQVVWAIGWGAIRYRGPLSPNLREVQIWTINQGICRQRYAGRGRAITDNMLCSGWLDRGGRDACQGDSGGPLIHNNVIVGITSFGHECAHPRYPGVNARVSRFTNWINSQA